MNIEKAVYFNDASFLNGIVGNRDFSRIYFGDEFCPFRLPKKDELELVLKYVKDNGLQFTFVTPWLTDDALEQVEKLLEIIPVGSEVVVNDYSLLMLKFNFIPILGRLLNSQIRGLRKGYRKRLSKNVLEHFQSSQPQIEILGDFYKEKGINRIELDNLPQGMKTDFKNMGFSASLYYPYGYIAVTRFCPYVITKNRFELAFSMKWCNRACRSSFIFLENKETDGKIFVKGNVHFYKNENLPENLSELGIDRLVEELI